MSRFCVLLLAAVMSIALTSCGKITENFGAAKFRIIHLSGEAGAVQVKVDDAVLSTSLAYENAVASTVAGGTRKLSITRVNDTTSISDASFGAAQDSSYTAVLLGYSSGYSTLLLSDSTTAPTGGNFKLRMASVAQGAGAVDIYVDAVGADIAAASPRVTQLFSRTVGDFQNISAGDYQVRATLAGTKDIVFDSGRMTFAQGQILTIYMYTSGSNRLLQAAMVPQDSTAAVTLIRGNAARARLVHAAVNVPALNAIVTPGSTLAGVAPNSAGTYGSFTSGTRSVRLEGALTPGAALATRDVTLAPASDTSLVATTATGALSILSFADSTVAPQATRVRARFVNLTTDMASIDVFLNTNRSAAAVTRLNASSYADFDRNTYTLGVNVAGATTGATLPSITLDGDGVYTVYVTGSAASLARVVVKEN
jgi:Domain of unknown function (DUF4397)